MSKKNNPKWSPRELQKIAKADDLKISPFRGDGITYGTPISIWNVAVNGDLYVRAYNGKKSRLYQDALQQKAVRIHAVGMIKNVSFEALVDGTINSLIDDAYKAKYKTSPYLGSMISERARLTTVKIVPGEKAD